jgi:UDP-N-acetylglucosamine transferase subunit ALG13
VIFVTVGGQLPFDRLVHAVDRWAAQQRSADVFAQIGDSTRPPAHIQWDHFLSPDEFEAKAREAEVLVAHAGMGSILTAFELEKPIIVMPRRAHLGEHRNDHQWATVKNLGDHSGITVAIDEEALLHELDNLDRLQAPSHEPGPEYARLLDFLRREIQELG